MKTIIALAIGLLMLSSSVFASDWFGKQQTPNRLNGTPNTSGNPLY